MGALGRRGGEREQHVRWGGELVAIAGVRRVAVVGGRDRRGGRRVRAVGRRGRRGWWVVAVVGLVLDNLSGRCSSRGGEILRLPPVEVAVAAACRTLDGGRVAVVGSWGRHELPASVQGVAAQAGSVVLEALPVDEAIRGRRRRLLVVALEDAVGEGAEGLAEGLDPGRCVGFGFRGLGAGRVRGNRGHLHVSNIKARATPQQKEKKRNT